MSTNQFRRYLDLLNEDPELSNPTQSSSEPRCTLCGTPKSQHQELKHPFLAGGAADRPVPVTQSGSAGGGDVGRIKKLQAELKAAGANLGSTGANRDGIDGDIGPLTTTAMSNYPDIAAKYPDLRGSSSAAPTGQAATPAIDTKKLDAALTAIEGILAKYKVKLSEDRESSTTDQMKQWRRLVEYREVDEEFINGNWYPAGTKANAPKRNPTGDVPVPSDFGKPPGPKLDSRGNPLPNLAAVPNPPAGAAAPTATSQPAAPAGKGAVRTAAGALGKQVSKLSPGVGLALAVPDVYDRAKAGDYTGATISGLAGLASLVPLKGTAIALGLGGLNAWLDSKKTPTVAISAEDAKIIADNVKILQDLGKDPASQDALTPELKTRIANTLKSVSSLGIPTQDPTPSSAQQAATPATAQQAATPADTSAAKAKAAVPAVNTIVADLDKLLKKNNFESREYKTLSEQLARDRDIVDEGLGSAAKWIGTNVIVPTAKFAYDKAIVPTVKGIASNIIAPAAKLATQAAMVGGIGYVAWNQLTKAIAPKTMSAEDKAEFDRIIADYKKAVPDQATFDALPKPVQEKLIDLADRLVKMEKEQGKR